MHGKLSFQGQDDKEACFFLIKGRVNDYKFKVVINKAKIKEN